MNSEFPESNPIDDFEKLFDEYGGITLSTPLTDEELPPLPEYIKYEY